MRTIHTDEIIKNVKEMCIEANLSLSKDVEGACHTAFEKETSPLGKQILGQLKENMELAKKEEIPICQDTGMAVVFLKIGQDLHIEGENLSDAINEGIRQGYREGYLRNSIVADPLLRKNTGDNTPGVIHYEIVPGENLTITVAPKGFGSENMSRVCMLKPSDGIEGVKKTVLETVSLAGPNACPPMIVGVGIGGTFEKCTLLAKKALLRDLNTSSPYPHIEKLEKELLEEINQLGIGPAGLGGNFTALGINIEIYPTHIAGLPVAVNICCHVNRHIQRII
jgi:fumarate hydratase subunit alpha